MALRALSFSALPWMGQTVLLERKKERKKDESESNRPVKK